MRVIGLTGSVGMGKSATAAIFRDFGIPVHDSDRAVHDIYAGPKGAPILEAFPAAAGSSGIDRNRLANIVLADPAAIKRLEELVHPLVSAHRKAFLDRARLTGARYAVCDVPLLFETGLDQDMDIILVVSAPFAVQKARVLQRPGMTPGKFDVILSKQMPDEEKRRRAHLVVDTSNGFDDARRQIDRFLRAFV